MKEIPVDQIREGDVLAADVRDMRGDVLLTRGLRLARRHAALLKRREITTVRVLTPDDTDVVPGSPDLREIDKAIARLEHMFEGLLDDPVMAEIHRVARGFLEGAKRA